MDEIKVVEALEVMYSRMISILTEKYNDGLEVVKDWK